MKPIKDSRTPNVAFKPTGMETCEDLPCFFDHRRGMIFSYWSVSWHERLAILFGRSIRVVIAGRVICPISLDTEEV